MKQFVTKGIILTRTEFGEADRIITLLTPDHGKLHLMAKGVRRIKSKLAGGIELFSVSSITYAPGRGELGTLISTRLIKHYHNILKDIDRTMLGYDLIKCLNKVTEDGPGAEYFDFLDRTFGALDDAKINTAIIKLWFDIQLLRLNGHTPNLYTDKANTKLRVDGKYEFNFNDSTLSNNPSAHIGADHIKFLRLGFSGNSPQILNHVQGSDKLAQAVTPLVTTMLREHLRL